jgi:glucoamylase
VLLFLRGISTQIMMHMRTFSIFFGVNGALADNCFVSLESPLDNAPFNPELVTAMRENFLRNINVNGTGAVVAARGAVPALHDCCPGGYTYHWMRDGALSMTALQELVGSDWSASDSQYAQEALSAYIKWVENMQAQTDADPHTEPKWDISSGKPYEGGWCRPQTDGPGLRAQALMYAAKSANEADTANLWKLVQFDLDWLAQGESTIGLDTCDLWEETQDPNFLWNRVTMRAALLSGNQFATDMGDTDRAAKYLQAAESVTPLSDHLHASGFLTECPADGGSDSCLKYGKDIDGAVILSLIHGGWREGTGIAPGLVDVAHTVEAYNELFCGLYPINSADTAAGVPGVLYGRYAADAYGSAGSDGEDAGNPWVLITASLAHLLYQAAQIDRVLTAEELQAWGAALNVQNFGGLPQEFIAAGDAVLQRLSHHVTADKGHLFEQIDRNTGQQYNAEDLTWSYAEVLTALKERESAVGLVKVLHV